MAGRRLQNTRLEVSGTAAAAAALLLLLPPPLHFLRLLLAEGAEMSETKGRDALARLQVFPQTEGAVPGVLSSLRPLPGDAVESEKLLP